MLTEVKIRALKPRARLYRVADGDGLCVEIPPNGSRLWRFRYRYGGNARMLSLGAWPAVALADARERRDAARKLLAKGINPSAERKAAKQVDALTLEAIAREWLARRNVSAATAAKDAWLVEALIAALGHR
ncbi:Arm DNA-binding domain-containing protein, partial [Metallibacterium sp.]|uniref:Arm DNA-binding domain-containing protein n=1 Tax=Metallibacterium sp. TaxID=2940281 RepID=UPI002608C8FE